MIAIGSPRAGLSAAAAAVGVTAVVAAATATGRVALAVAVLAAQALVVAGWYAVADVPGAGGGAVVAMGAGAAADVAMLVRDTPSLEPAGGVLGLAMVAALGHQVLRRDGRARVVASLTATVSAAGLAVLASALIAERDATLGGTVTVVTVLAAGAGAAVAGLVPAPPVAETVAVGAAVALGSAVGAPAGDMTVANVAAVALGAGVFAVIARRVVLYAAYRPDRGTVEGRGGAVGADAPGGVPGAAGAQSASARMATRTQRRAAARAARRQGEAVLLFGATLPVALTGPVAYVLGRLLVG